MANPICNPKNHIKLKPSHYSTYQLNPSSSLPRSHPPPSTSILSSSTPPLQLTPSLKRTIPVPANPINQNILIPARRWLITFALINFDLDQGPDFDNCYPPAIFSPALLANVAFSSFPDSAQTGSLLFNWRIPARDAPSPSTSHPPEAADLCGFVYFLQQRDPSVHRGYNQRSLVLITHLLDYAGLFAALIARLGPLHALQGPSVLEAALANMATWPDPAHGAILPLDFLGQSLRLSVPLANQAQLLEPRPQMLMQSSSSSSGAQILASTPPTYLSYILFGRPPPLQASTTIPAPPPPSTPAIPISTLWTLWEIVVLAEPLVVYGSNPEVVSVAVLHLKNLIRPIPFQGDWRPYITIHDPDFPSLFNKTKARTATLIGATNPIIFSNTHTWPHVLNLSSSSFSSHGGGSGGGGGGHGGHIPVGLSTERRRQIQKDKATVKLIEGCLARRDYHQADVIISRYFSVLTEQFLQPLQRYFTTLLPVERERALVQAPSRPNSFNEDVFLKSLKAHATLLDFRPRLGGALVGGTSSVAAFYTRFLRAAHFAGWLHAQVDAAARAVQERYVARLASPGEVERWVEGKSEAQVAELVARIEAEVAAGTTGGGRAWTASEAPEQRWSFDVFGSSSRTSTATDAQPHPRRGARRPSVPGMAGAGTSSRTESGGGGGGGRTERLRAQAERLRMMSFGPSSQHQSLSSS